MTYRIARSALHAFVDEQIALIEATPVPADIRQIAPTGDVPDTVLDGVWLSAGLATQLGLALIDAPERFVEDAPEAA